MDLSETSLANIAANPPTHDMQQAARLARRSFNSLERLVSQLMGYPPGHPAIEQALQTTHESFMAFFELTDRLSVKVLPHSLAMLDNGEEVWETEEPKDYCFYLSRDGLFLLHILAGIDLPELRRLAEVLEHIVERRYDPNFSCIDALFDANFRYISYDALDESLAALAGIDMDMRNRDTREEQDQIDELFQKAMKGEEAEQDDSPVEGDYEIRIKNPIERMRKIEVGSREFLTLEDEVQQRLLGLRQGFIEHRELEHREGELLSAILGAQPREALRLQAVEQIGEVMGALVGTEQPWEALTFMKIIHHWRDKFAPEVTHELKDVVQQAFNKRRVQELVRQVTQQDRQNRRMILQMFNALHMEEASSALARVVGWSTLDDETREDVLRYLRERSRYGFEFFEESILELPFEHSAPVMEILEQGMPHSRAILIKLVGHDVEPPLKAQALRILHGTWSNPSEVRDLLVPLTRVSSSALRLQAIRSLVDATPQHAYRVLEPLFNQDLAKRSEEEVRELAQLFVKHGGPQALTKLEELVHRRGLTTTEAERELAVTIARALMRTPDSKVVALLDAVAKDWLVPQRIRSTCKEIADMLRVGS